jgi:NAD(P)-dependent dehydrogenase (short-subunit alcohol dehydrogenase family)
MSLASAGAGVAITARGLEGLTGTAALIEERTGVAVLVVPGDVSSLSDMEQLQTDTLRQLGVATILVNAAGVYGPLAPFSATEPRGWIQTLMVNTVGPYLTCRLFVGGMLEAGWGRIVNVSSAASLYPPTPFDSAYATSKAALNRLTRHLADEIAGSGVTANVIHPGSLKTEMWADIRAQLGHVGDGAVALRSWADLVERTGGDPLSKATDLVLSLLEESSGGISGQFCWPRDALEEPVASW